MMNKKIYSIGLLIALMFLVGWSWGCEQKKSAVATKTDAGAIEQTETPQKTLKQFSAALQKNDQKAVLQLVTIDKQQRWQRILEILPADARELLAQAVESAEVVEQNETMAKARIKTQVPGVTGGEDFIYLRKEGGVWKMSAL